MSQEQDKIFFRNFSLSLLVIAVMMVIFFIAAKFAGTDEEAEAKMREATVAATTAPVGQVATTDDASAEASVSTGDSISMGQAVYDGLCVNCHGIAALASMIPQTGDAAAWEERVEKGIDTLYNNAINGFTGKLGMMPPRGSNPALSDDEVKAAVDYMISEVK